MLSDQIVSVQFDSNVFINQERWCGFCGSQRAASQVASRALEKRPSTYRSQQNGIPLYCQLTTVLVAKRISTSSSYYTSQHSRLSYIKLIYGTSGREGNVGRFSKFSVKLARSSKYPPSDWNRSLQPYAPNQVIYR